MTRFRGTTGASYTLPILLCCTLTAHVAGARSPFRPIRGGYVTTTDTPTLPITEIMFDPVDIAGKTTAEYVEIHNPGESAVPIGNWRLIDETGTVRGTIPSNSPPVQPGAYVVVAADSSIYLRFPALRDSLNVVVIGRAGFSLNADGDEVVLRDAEGRSVDSVPYRAEWHWEELDDTKGISLERISRSASSIDGRNWSSSLERLGGTPGRRNSRMIPASNSQARLRIEPETLSPDGDGFQDFIRIGYRLPVSRSRITVTLYDRLGRRAARIANNEPAGAEGELIWNGEGENGRPLEPGIYVIRLEAYDQGGIGIASAQAAVVVARKL